MRKRKYAQINEATRELFEAERHFKARDKALDEANEKERKEFGEKAIEPVIFELRGIVVQ